MNVVKTVALFGTIVSLCAGGLVTNARQTVLQVGEACDDEPFWCAPRLSCLGEERSRKCFRKRTEGEQCGADPFWSCEESLTCRNSTCVSIGREGDRCNNSTRICAPKLSCIGNRGDTKCFMKQYKGGLCPADEPFWVCREELTCVKGVCKEVNITEGGVCNTDNELCAPSLECVGAPWQRRCVRKRVLGEGDACDEDDVVCREGLFCLGDAGTPKCFAGRAEGERCGLDPFWACTPPLICDPRGLCAQGSNETSLYIRTDSDSKQ